MDIDMSNNSSTTILDSSVFSIIITSLILFSVVTFSMETLPDLSARHRQWLRYAEYVIVTLFTLEYLTRIYLAREKLKFIFSFYGVVDLIAILPFFLAFTVDLTTLRLLRLLRLARLIKLARYNTAFHRFTRALYMAKEELVIFTLDSFVLLYLSAVGIYHFEHAAQPDVFRSIFDSLWWSVATLTTVGYGDIYPITLGGKMFTFCVLMIGLGLIAVPTGIVASALSAVRHERRESE
tara:strand:- start:1002 stop:1712 length:711 start_codon:yes stop_codon:yes gene_type:complete